MLEDIKEYIIRADKSLLETLVRINYLSEKLSALTLFVVDTENRVVGSVTDGDIRRGLLKGIKLDESVDKVMSREFISLSTNDFVYTKLKFIREKQIKLVPVLNGKGEIVKIVDFNLGRSYLPIDAVLMAGGKGERLRPMTLTCPKPLLLVADKPIIDYNIDNLLRNGIENINVTVNYLKEQIKLFDPKVYVYVSKSDKSYDYIGNNVKTMYYTNMSEGVIIKYKNKIYDYSI